MSNWPEQLILDGEGPVYDQIKRAILSNIRSGDWETGHRIPAEADLAKHFQTARMTVNRALKELTQDGLIVRRRRAGSFVASPPSPSALLEIVDMSTTIPERGQDYSYECLTREVIAADGETARRMRVSPGTMVLHLICRHSADSDIVELEDRWINLDLLPQAATQDFRKKAPGAWLLEASPWTEAEHIVSAINATEDLAKRLKVDVGAACLVLERRTFQTDTVVTYARLTHPGNRHALSERFSPRRN
jgi:GntR family histidine utilization transcriptional repressor